MSDFSSEDLQGILREQNELRLRLIALDRKIESLRFEETISTQQRSPTEPTAPTLLTEVPAPPPLPTIPTAPVQKSSWEFQLGTVWLVRIGIVILLTGLVFLGNYAYHHIVPRIGPWVKLALLYFLGGALVGIGARLERGAESLRNYGRVLLAGGAALLYYTTYGATFVEKLRVIDSPLIGGLLLLGVGGVVIWLAEKRQTQSVALMAILLSYYTAAINPLGVFSFYSSLLLTVAAVWLMLRNRWTTIGIFSLVGTYGSYTYWQFFRSEPIHGAGFLLGYWLLFTAAVFLSRSTQFTPEKRTPFLTLNNAAFYGLVFQIIHAHYPEWTGRFSLGFGAVLLGLAWFAKRRQTEDLFLDGAYLIQGLGVLTFGLMTELNGYQLSLALAIQGTLMLFSINRRHGWIFEIGAGIVTLLAFAIDFSQRLYPHQETVWWTLIAIFMADAWLVKNYKKRATPILFNWLAAAYCVLAIGKLALLLANYYDTDSRELYWCLASLILLLVGTVIRLRELAIIGQILALTAAFDYIVGNLKNTLILNQLAILFTPLSLVYWWQRQTEIRWRFLGQTGFFLIFVAIFDHWLETSSSLIPKTLVWASLGTVALCLGLAIRERTYRVCGLALLGLATIRVFVIDIWGLDPIFRILSFIVLGVVLLGIGFIYNKFADKLKEWL